MDMSNFDERNSSENQQLPTFKDPKGCLDITTNHQKDDDTKKIVILHQDPKGCQDIIMDEQKDDDDANKIKILHQNNPKGSQDITIGIKKIMVLQEDPKGCQGITMDTNNIVILHQVPNQDHHGDVLNETIVIQHVEDELVPEDSVVIQHVEDEDIQHVEDDVDNNIIVALLEDDNDGFRTPTSLESKIPILTTCPGAPRGNYSGIKRKASSPPRRGERNIRIWNDYRHRDTARF
ncbi:uncharacterized protein LOC125871737 [Solanum stenotomum]|uniref:uncharacterized protein LOC125871737 n=1 Tax=Solanum stenotomum TaxID=172797 RepID=UPI0020D0BD63|nr:uncharacterized protein LOC125871737 [Solanum stenotomum]